MWLWEARDFSRGRLHETKKEEYQKILEEMLENDRLEEYTINEPSIFKDMNLIAYNIHSFLGEKIIYGLEYQETRIPEKIRALLHLHRSVSKEGLVMTFYNNEDPNASIDSLDYPFVRTDDKTILIFGETLPGDKSLCLFSRNINDAIKYIIKYYDVLHYRYDSYDNPYTQIINLLSGPSQDMGFFFNELSEICESATDNETEQKEIEDFFKELYIPYIDVFRLLRNTDPDKFETEYREICTQNNIPVANSVITLAKSFIISKKLKNNMIRYNYQNAEITITGIYKNASNGLVVKADIEFPYKAFHKETHLPAPTYFHIWEHGAITPLKIGPFGNLPYELRNNIDCYIGQNPNKIKAYEEIFSYLKQFSQFPENTKKYKLI